MCIKYVSVILILCFFQFGCLKAQGNKVMENSNSTIKKSFGTFILPDDWIEATGQSRNGKFFYVYRKSNNNPPTNISIEAGTNRYNLDEMQTFSQAIMRQLVMQTGGKAAINAGGTFTEQGYPLIYFIIEDIDTPDQKTIQYYIVGEKKYILLHLTDFHDVKVTNAEEVVVSIANSFIWAE